jgi:hypothetical protein
MKLAKDVKAGDTLTTIDGAKLKVKSVERGFFTRPSVLIHYTNGEWSCLLKDDPVEQKAKQ